MPPVDLRAVAGGQDEGIDAGGAKGLAHGGGGLGRYGAVRQGVEADVPVVDRERAKRLHAAETRGSRRDCGKCHGSDRRVRPAL
jgi:hypothetical protein